MVSVVSSIPAEANFSLKFVKPLDVNSDLKCKCDIIVKNSTSSTSVLAQLVVTVSLIGLIISIAKIKLE